MKREIMYRTTRIVMVICFLIIASFLRANAVESYESSSYITNDLSNNLKVEVLENYSLSDNDYVFSVTNYGTCDRDFVIALDYNSDNTIPNSNVMYSIIKDDNLVISDSLSDEAHLSTETLEVDETSVYRIKFWLSDDSINGVFSSKIILI